MSLSINSPSSAHASLHDTGPFWLPIVAGLPLGFCLVVITLPSWSGSADLLLRSFFLLMYLVWTLPLTWLQRQLWRHNTVWYLHIVLIFLATSIAALISNALGMGITLLNDSTHEAALHWRGLFRGLEARWIMLITFCAVHAVIAYYLAFRQQQLHAREASNQVLRAELRALRYQLNPHFLFNTLNAISSLVGSGQARAAQEMINRLADFMRITLKGSDTPEVTVAEEWALTEAYLAIEKARLAERLRVEWHIGPDVLSAMLPVLLLQPLVENAIRHGIALSRTGGRLLISIRRRDNQLLIVVDNDEVDTLNMDVVTNDSSTRIGLSNISERLKRLYPKQFRFESYRHHPHCFRVSIELPLRHDNVSEQMVSTT